MKSNTSKQSRPRKEDSQAGDQIIYQRLMDSITKLVENNSQVVENNNKVVENCAKLAATNDSLTSIIERLSVAEQPQRETADKISRPNPSGEANDPNAQTPGPTSLCRKEWENQYSVLTEDNRNNPMQVLTLFARITSLFQQRRDLNMLYWGAMQSELFEDLDGETRGDWVAFYNSLMELMEATYRIAEMIKKKELVINYQDTQGTG